MSSCSLVIVRASLKNMVSRKTRLKFLVPKTEVEHDVTKKFNFHNFSNSGLKFYMRISECICNRIMMKKNMFFDPFTGEAPLKLRSFSTLIKPMFSIISYRTSRTELFLSSRKVESFQLPYLIVSSVEQIIVSTQYSTIPYGLIYK